MAQPGMMVMVAVPEGMQPGQQLQVDPDGPQGPLPPVMVTVGALSKRVSLPSAVRARPLPVLDVVWTDAIVCRRLH